MKQLRFALAILALAILACSRPGEQLPTQTTPVATALAISATPLPTEESDALVIVTAFEALHVRAAPGYRSEIVDYLYVGEEVTLTSECSKDPPGWAQIEWNGGTAWVRAKYLSDNLCKE